MKLKAPQGVGDPSVAGVAIRPCNGVYEVEADVGALLIECFGFVEVGANVTVKVPPATPPLAAPRRPTSAPLPKLTLPAFRARPLAKNP